MKGSVSRVAVKTKNFLRSTIMKAIYISLVTVVVTLCIIAGLLYYYRARIFQILARGYVAQQQSLASSQVPSPLAVNDATTNTALAPLLSTVAPAPADTVVSAVKKAQPAVVSVVVSEETPKYSISYQNQDTGIPGMSFQTPVYTQDGTQKQAVASGSGFLISADGLIVTNRHVVDDPKGTFEVTLNNGKSYPATVLAKDPVFDVALIKINATGLPYLTLGNSDTLEVGQSVVAIGNALGQFSNSVSSGVISGLSRSITAGDETGQSEQLDKVIQTDAAINPGNSGGPLLNLAGDVIGIDVAVVQGSSNIGFALPINSVKSIIDSVRATGKIIYPYLGIRYVTITPDVQTSENLPVDYGILVAPGQTASDVAVIPGSPAEKAGIVQGDIILSVDGQKIDSNFDFADYIRTKKIGDTLKLVVLSKGVQKTVSVSLVQGPTS
jgi:serine protease Do